MREYVIVSDSTADLPVELIRDMGVVIVPFSYAIEQDVYQYCLDEKDDIEAFYDKLKKGAMPVTSQINPETYKEYFEKIAAEGKDILYLGFSSGLSGTYQASQIAVSMVEEDYPDVNIMSVDSLSASVGQGAILYLAAQKKADGMSIEDLHAWLMEKRHNVRHWFMVEDLFHLKRGGRVNTVEAMVGFALKIKLILSVDEEGKLVVKSKTRGVGKAVEYLVDKFAEEAFSIEDSVAVVGHASAPDKAEKIKESLLKKGVKEENIIVAPIGPIIGTHVGAGMAAVAFLGNNS